MTTKMTRKELFTALLNLDEVKANAVWVEKLNAEIEAIDKKNANRKPTTQQIENESIKDVIMSVMSATEGKTVTQIMKDCARLGTEFKSNQQCTALLRQLRLDGKVTRVEDKKSTLYFIADEEEA